MLSCLPEIPAEIILSIDKDPAIGQWLNFLASALSSQTTSEECTSLVFSHANPIYALATKLGDRTLDKDFEVERRYLAEKHFLSSRVRYEQCQNTLKNKQIIAISADIGDINLIAQIGEVLRSAGSQVTFGNLTNVWEFVGDQLAEALGKLPVNPDAIFLHSSFGYRFRRGGHAHPEAQWKIQGLEKFIAEEKREFNLYQESRQLNRL